MNRGEKPGTAANTSHAQQFQPPDKPLRIRPAPVSHASRGPSALTTRTETPASSASTSRSWKRNSFPAGRRDQTTLTQIDFVTPISQDTGSNDDDLDYIDERSRSRRRNPRDVIEIDDDSGNDAEQQPPSRRQPNRTRGVRFEQGAKDDTPRQKRKSSPSGGVIKQRRRKSGEGSKSAKKDKDRAKGNKTLTQMDYVRRYLKIEPDEDVKLEYTYITPKKSDERNLQRTYTRDTEGTPSHQHHGEQSSSERKRKLNGDAKPTEGRGEMSAGPVTPRKQIKHEIPSSQSPESPGIAIITSSQFRGATRSPQKLASASTARIKEESTRLYNIKEEAFQDSEPMLLFPDEIPSPSIVPNSPPSRQHTITDEASIDALVGPARPQNIPAPENNLETPDDREAPLNTQRTVVYETDAETDSGDDEELPDAPGSPRNPKTLDHIPRMADDLETESPNGESEDQDLPPINPSGLDVETEPPSEINPTSEASIYYQRLQPATQFPLGSIPTLNTQKMAELFPEDSNDQQNLRTMSPLPSSPQTQSRAMHKPDWPVIRQTQIPDPDRIQTEIVPESSPIARHGNGAETQDSVPREFVQVESSQAVDRLAKHNREEDSGPRGIFSRSQILTSSVMESIPLPAFLMDSQDSVGEPYSQPE
ncbi:hypothetical protein BO70DRAFT_321539 [Aspergillus heteromorphus CBS 117.55]|uniref:Uncharacterized protein n=1 Tax=Aspergillus heteromorphus CBS 117.55 TaxID=1448321 RepID=A0A317VDK3_9EURO|nr:uncharacterized protein BO70DRAFT_321539 [Aspergillus heteromorphus CBS 117.55]PWY70972.1 hypothetical protein BO70DRAFT_321539 [Aspergillus heteromorphus CBS 117.55]